MESKAFEWRGDRLALLDQKRLPVEVVWVELTDWRSVAEAIRDMTVRGAPIIGIAAAYGMALAALAQDDLEVAHRELAATRPTAVNLFWALDRISRVADNSFENILREAHAIAAEDLELNRAIGEFGASLIPENAKILTVCNTGFLATGGLGTALGVIRIAHQQGKVQQVWSCETRPRQQGLRLTAWELMQDQIPFRSIPDGAAASLMKAGEVDFVIAGADRIAANGDTANKIGTYALAVAAHHHGIPFVIAAPSSTLDLTLADGSGIPIEERDATEMTHIEGVQVAPTGCPVYNPGFDVTPGELITAIITESGIHRAPFWTQNP